MLKDLTASQRKPTSRVMKVRSPIFSPNSARNYSTEYSLHELIFSYTARLPCDAIFAPAHNSTHQKPISDGIPITPSDQFSTWFHGKYPAPELYKRGFMTTSKYTRCRLGILSWCINQYPQAFVIIRSSWTHSKYQARFYKQFPSTIT